MYMNKVYRVIQGKVSQLLTNIWISSDESKIFYGFQHVPNMIAIDLLPLDFVESNIRGLHSLQQKECQKSVK